MIIDKILDRKDFIEFDGWDIYDAHDFYIECMQYSKIFDGIGDEITLAMDCGTEQDVKKALCNYIDNNDYNPKIKDFINAVEWLESQDKPLKLKIKLI